MTGKNCAVLGVVLATLACGDHAPPPSELREATQSITYNGHDYLFVLTPHTWANARAYCARHSYGLVSPNDSNEMSFLRDEESLHGGGQWWIGYSDQETEGTWLWTGAGGPSTYSDWAPGQPDNYLDEDCAIDGWSSAGRWNDEKCSNSFKFICESVDGAAAAMGTQSYSASNTSSATQNTFNRTFNLSKDNVFTVGTCGVPGAWAAFWDDTFLRLYNQNGQLVALNDDACGGRGSNFSYVVPAAGTYTLKAGCWGSSSCGGTFGWMYY